MAYNCKFKSSMYKGGQIETDQGPSTVTVLRFRYWSRESCQKNLKKSRYITVKRLKSSKFATFFLGCIASASFSSTASFGFNRGSQAIVLVQILRGVVSSGAARRA